jgi:hypothetical protein
MHSSGTTVDCLGATVSAKMEWSIAAIGLGYVLAHMYSD